MTDILVITATLGARDSLKRTVSSVAEHGGQRVKHIITCPRKEINNLKTVFPHLEIVAEPENKKGIYPALNSAIKRFATKYKYVTYINDDDYWLPGFKKLITTMDENEQLDAVYAKTLFVNENNNKIGEQTSSPRYKSFKVLLKKKIVLFTQQATLIKSELFYKIGGFDESYKLIADSKFWVKAIDLNATFSYVNCLAAAYTIQQDQLSSNKTTQNKEYIRLFQEKQFNKIDEYEIMSESALFRLRNLLNYIKR